MSRNLDPLSNTGLAERLDQHARRGGVSLGVMMALCIVIAIAGFVYLYTRLDFFPDSRTRATNPAAGGILTAGSASAAVRLTPATTRTALTPGANATSIAGAAVAPSATANRPAAANGTPGGTPGPTATPAFTANYRIAAGQSINFRSDANTNSNRLKSLPPGTELQYSGQSQDVGGEKWLRMRDGSGSDGWVREIDVEKIPG